MAAADITTTVADTGDDVSEPKLTVLSFIWGTRYDIAYVNRLGQGLRRHMDVPYRFVVVTDRARQFGPTVDYQEPLPNPELAGRGCFCRLVTFSTDWQRKLGLTIGDRVLVLDLDLVIVGNLRPLLERDQPFVILQGVNSPTHPTPYNGSVWLTTAGYRPDVWDDFSVEAAEKLPKAEFADDQQWMFHKLPNAGAYTEKDGVWAFRKGAWEADTGLPANARIVAFPGRRDPSQFVNLPWLRRHWLGIA